MCLMLLLMRSEGENSTSQTLLDLFISYLEGIQA